MRHDGVIEAQQPAAGFDDFYRSHVDRARSLAHLITGSRMLGQEIAQDAMIAVHGAWEQLDEPAAFLRTVVVNRSRSVQRRLIRERLHLGRATVDTATGIPELDETWAEVRRLPAAQRTVVVLRYYEDLSLAEIAEVLDQPLGTVKSTLHRATARLKERLDV